MKLNIFLDNTTSLIEKFTLTGFPVTLEYQVMKKPMN